MNILITGASSGIGFDLCKRLVKKGEHVIVTVHTKKEVNITVEKLKELHINNVEVIKLDITKEKDRNLINNYDIDVLVNTSAIGVSGSLLNLEVFEIRKNFETNFFSTLELIKTYIKNRGNKPSKVVITSSLAGYMPIPFWGSYTSSKIALTMFIKCLNRELKMTNLNVKLKLILPGAYYTGFNEYIIETKEKLNNTIFKGTIEKEIRRERHLFRLIEKKRLNSVINTYDRAIYSKNNRLKYKVPFTQWLLSKIYLLLLM